MQARRSSQARAPARVPRRGALARVVTTLAALAGLVLCACMGACGRDPAKTPAQVVHIYNWADYIGPDTVREFEQRTGIRVIYDNYDSDETLEAKLMTGDSGYDVVSTSTNYFARQIRAGVYRPLDRKLLPNWGNLDPHALEVLARFDPGNRYAMPYLRAVNGFAYNVGRVHERMADAPLDSLDMLFRPEVVRRFADCGVTFIDDAETVLQLALNYLHLDPNSDSAEDYARAEALLRAVRPYVRAFDSSEYMNGLANGEFCISMSWSGDYAAALARARAAGLPLQLRFTVPREGANGAFDALLIPADAPDPGPAHRFLNYMLEPQVMAAVTNAIHYANNNAAATPYVDAAIRADPAVYPTPQIEARLYYSREVSPALKRLRSRTWTRIKTGY